MHSPCMYALPLHVRKEEEITRFKTAVKTILFNGAEEFKRTAFKYVWILWLQAHLSSGGVTLLLHWEEALYQELYYYYYY